MEQPGIASLQDGHEEAYVLFWPPTGVEGNYIAFVYVVMVRQEGLLLAVPVGFISPPELQEASQTDGSVLIGPHTVITVPGVRTGAEGTLEAGVEVDVQLVDLSDLVLPGLLPWAESGVTEEQLVWFSQDPTITPDLPALLQGALGWLQASGAQRATFYSAAEEEEVPPPKKAVRQKEKAKRSTPAKQVADHITTMASLLPSMAAQLASMQEEQRALQAEVRGYATTPPPRPGQQPVSMTTGQFASMMGAPPKTKGFSPLAAASKGFPACNGLSPEPQGAGRRRPRRGRNCRRQPVDPSSAGTEQGTYGVGSSDAVRRSSVRGAHQCGFCLIEGSPGQGETSEGVSSAFGELLPHSDAEYVQEDETSFTSPTDARRTCKHRPFHGALPGAFWKFRKHKRHGSCSLCGSLRCGLCAEGGPSRPQRAPCIAGGGHGAVLSGHQVGPGIHTHVAGGPSPRPCFPTEGTRPSRQGGTRPLPHCALRGGPP